MGGSGGISSRNFFRGRCPTPSELRQLASLPGSASLPHQGGGGGRCVGLDRATGSVRHLGGRWLGTTDARNWIGTSPLMGEVGRGWAARSGLSACRPARGFLARAIAAASWVCRRWPTAGSCTRHTPPQPSPSRGGCQPVVGAGSCRRLGAAPPSRGERGAKALTDSVRTRALSFTPSLPGSSRQSSRSASAERKGPFTRRTARGCITGTSPVMRGALEGPVVAETRWLDIEDQLAARAA